MNTHTMNFLENPVSGSFCGAVIGQSAQILSCSAHPPPCHMQSTMACLCSTLHLGVLPKDLLTSYPGLPPWSLCLVIWGRLTRQIILSLLILPQTKLHAPLLIFSLGNFSRKCVLLRSLSPHNQLSNGAIVTFPCTIQHAHHTPTLRKKIKLIKKN